MAYKIIESQLHTVLKYVAMTTTEDFFVQQPQCIQTLTVRI